MSATEFHAGTPHFSTTGDYGAADSNPFEASPRDVHVVEVPFESIELEAAPFRYTEEADNRDLVASLRDHGQREAILVLAGRPHRILDGHRRVAALRELGAASVCAEVMHVENEAQAQRLAFLRQVARRVLDPVQRGRAIGLARSRGRSLQDIATDLNLSVKQVRRYLALLELPEVLAEFVRRDEVSMAHARVLAQCPAADLEGWIRTYQRMRWSASRLRDELARATAANEGPTSVLVQESGGVLRIHSFTVDESVSAEERQVLRRQLVRAIEFLDRSQAP